MNIELMSQSWNDLETSNVVLKEAAKLDEYKWLEPCIGPSLQDIASKYLSENKPESDRFKPLELEENLYQLNAMLNRCLDRRSEIAELEANAINFALDAIADEQIFISDEASFRIQLAANIKQSNNEVDQQEIDRIASQKFLALRNSHRAKINLHNKSGSPLNFGERALRAKRLYCESLRALYERAMSVSLALESAYGFECPPIPSTDEVAIDLDNITWWLRGIVRKIENSERHEATYNLSLRIFRDLIPAGSQIDASKSFSETGALNFTLTNEVAAAAGLPVELEECRIVGFAAFISGRLPVAKFQEDYQNKDGAPVINYYGKTINNESANDETLLKTLAYSCKVTPPIQRLNERQVIASPLDLGHIPVCFESTYLEKWRGEEPGSLRNINPAGSWKIELGNQSISHPNGLCTRKDLFKPIAPPTFTPTDAPDASKMEVMTPKNHGLGTVSLGVSSAPILEDLIIVFKFVTRKGMQ